MSGTREEVNKHIIYDYTCKPFLPGHHPSWYFQRKYTPLLPLNYTK